MTKKDMHDEEKSESDRRSFLQQCGRFALVTPPVVSLMLTVGEKGVPQALAASGSKKHTETTGSKSTSASATSNTATSITNTTGTSITNTTGLMDPGTKPHTDLAMVIDSMGLMKIG